MTTVYEPGTLAEIWDIKERYGDGTLFAGGTDLFVRLRSGGVAPRILVSLAAVDELHAIEKQKDGLFIGALATHRRLLSDPLITRHFPLLPKAVSVLGSPPIRNMGTLGGNLCTASPAGDTLPPLYALDAEVELRSRDRARRMPVREFITGPGKTLLAPGEIVCGVRLRIDDSFTIHHFEKVGQRNALAIAIASFAALLKMTDKGIIEKARFAWGSVGPTIVTSQEVEEALTGAPLNRDALESVRPMVERAVSPIDDVRAKASYRKALAGNLLVRLLEYAAPARGGRVRTKRKIPS